MITNIREWTGCDNDTEDIFETLVSDYMSARDSVGAEVDILLLQLRDVDFSSAHEKTIRKYRAALLAEKKILQDSLAALREICLRPYICAKEGSGNLNCLIDHKLAELSGELKVRTSARKTAREERVRALYVELSGCLGDRADEIYDSLRRGTKWGNLSYPLARVRAEMLNAISVIQAGFGQAAELDSPSVNEYVHTLSAQKDAGQEIAHTTRVTIAGPEDRINAIITQLEANGFVLDERTGVFREASNAMT